MKLFIVMILALLSFTSVASIHPDTLLRPRVIRVSPPVNGTYWYGHSINFNVEFTQTVTITGTPRVPLIIGNQTRYASYLSGSGSRIISFRYTVTENDLDQDGIEMRSPLELNGGSIKHGHRNAALKFLIPNTKQVMIDGLLSQAPKPMKLSATASGRVSVLSWTSAGPSQTYTLYRGTTSGAFTKLADEITSPFSDTTVVRGMTYYYQVRTSDNSSASNEVSVRVLE